MWATPAGIWWWNTPIRQASSEQQLRHQDPGSGVASRARRTTGSSGGCRRGVGKFFAPGGHRHRIGSPLDTGVGRVRLDRLAHTAPCSRLPIPIPSGAGRRERRGGHRKFRRSSHHCLIGWNRSGGHQDSIPYHHFADPGKKTPRNHRTSTIKASAAGSDSGSFFDFARRAAFVFSVVFAGLRPGRGRTPLNVVRGCPRVIIPDAIFGSP